MNQTKSNEPLIPPFRFAIVEEGLFRGSYPTDRNFRFLKRMKLKTIISLTPKPPTKSFYTFCERYGTSTKHFSVSKFKDDVTLSASQVVQLLEIMIDPSNFPIYIHCLDGANVTGTVFMCLRKLQNWNLSTIFTEFTRFTRGGTIASAEAEFVETFKAEIDVSPKIPQWLWQGVRMTKHPTLKLRLMGDQNIITPSVTGQPQHQQLQQHNTPVTPTSTSLLQNINSSTNQLLNNPIQLTKDPIPMHLDSKSISTSVQPSLPQQIFKPIASVPSNISNTMHQTPTTTSPQTTTTTTTPISTSSIIQNPNNNNISNSSITQVSVPSTPTSSTKDKDKKKRIDDIKLQFDSGKFLIQNESRSLEALSLERKCTIAPLHQSQHLSSQPTQSTTSQSTTHSPSHTPSESKRTPLIFSSSNVFNK
ncbi:hypothetical protein DLAC_00460 [Tieghemostelium lacteum]|uniref:Tyrosine phosphatase family protein n=1 Tax=Tieghemostelium lacteum TaxID=361077 RepID=A0A152A9S9_TIELA|nr:hypothetical protein DLAC_00460 [Tieghemostelium lacteum]|eukprot:KYR02976.1 hypothetical protein DLAC_00460 [Tieghemostelium lacteum]